MYDWAEFRHFRYLLAILEKRGFRAAAETLHTAQPNLSIQARQFQENAAVRLFRKTRNGRIRPTEAGIAFMAMARILLETRDEIIDALIAIERGAVGPMRFGCSPFVDPRLFRTLCSIQKELLPSSTVRTTHGDTPQLAEEVADGAVDAAIVTLPLMHRDLHIEEVRQDRLVVCLRKDHVLAAKANLQPADLKHNLTVLCRVGDLRPRAALRPRLGQCGGRADYCVSVRTRARDAYGDYGRHRQGSRRRRAYQQC
jgi:DNA-binding transcriptional LysR family regulator